MTDAINDCYLDMLIDGILDDKEYRFGIKKKFNTACWTFNDKDQHQIAIGDQILTNPCVKEDLTEEQKKRYIGSYTRHETYHSLWTLRDFKLIQNILKNEKIPFKLFNLFEDARIEARGRAITGINLNWVEFENLYPAQSPKAFFFHCIQHEGNNIEEISGYERYAKVYTHYFLNAIKCQDTLDLVPLLKEWLEEFKAEQDSSSSEKPEKNDGSPRNSDLEHASNSELDEKDFVEVTTTIKSEGLNGVVPHELHTKNSFTESSNIMDKLCVHCQDSVDQKLVDKLTPLAIKALQHKKAKKRSQGKTTRYLNVKNAIHKKYDRLYNKKVPGRKKRKINVIVDLSGSMSGEPSLHARTIVAIFNELCAKHIINGNLILSAGRRVHLHGLAPFPVEHEIIKKLEGFANTEELAQTFKVYEAEMKRADINFVITDGMINDDPIDKATLHSKGIYTIGIYVGNPSDAHLDKWFDMGIAKKTLHEAIDHLIYATKSV